MARFAVVARVLLAKQGIELASVEVYPWQSTENPEDKQLVLAFTVIATAEAALRLWDQLTDEMYGAIEREPLELRAPLRDAVILSVKWKAPARV